MKILIVDANSVCHRAKHKFGGLSYKGEGTGVIYGFFMEVLFLLEKYRPDLVCCCWDSFFSLRNDVYPEYKEKRTKKKAMRSRNEQLVDNMFRKQFDIVNYNILPKIGLTNNFKVDGYEGDDLIASIIKYNPKHEFVIVTSDEDMYQLLGQNVVIYNLDKKRNYTKDDFTSEYNISPTLWSEVKSIAGCKSDEVAGIENVGTKTAIKYLNGKLSKTVKVYGDIVSDTGKEIIKRNRGLVTLPLKGTPKLKLKLKQKINIIELEEQFTRYGIQSMIKKLPEWKELLHI